MALGIEAGDGDAVSERAMNEQQIRDLEIILGKLEALQNDVGPGFAQDEMMIAKNVLLRLLSEAEDQS